MDRNSTERVDIDLVKGSLSARRAWIEIGNGTDGKEPGTSLSARRAWIEIG